MRADRVLRTTRRAKKYFQLFRSISCPFDRVVPVIDLGVLVTSPQPPSGADPSTPSSSGPSAHPPAFGRAPAAAAGPPQQPVSGPPYGSPASGPPAARPGRGVARLAMLVAAVAVLLSLGSLGVAAWALSKADNAEETVAALPSAPSVPQDVTATEPAADPTTDTEPTTGPDPVEPPAGESNAPVNPLNPQSVFKLFYEKRTLNVQATGCDTRKVDLDEPRLDAEGAADISLDACTGGIAKMEFSDGVVAAVGESAMTPNACAEQIQFSAIPSTKEYAMRKGDAYCIQTSLAAANSRGDSQRMVIVTVTGVSADNLVTLQATAYIVPQ
jgi:hypothetical protein